MKIASKKHKISHESFLRSKNNGVVGSLIHWKQKLMQMVE